MTLRGYQGRTGSWSASPLPSDNLSCIVALRFGHTPLPPDCQIRRIWQFQARLEISVRIDYRASNTGFGLSYTLPVLVAILSADPGGLLLLENPESHLHPKGQAKMGELMARAASCGIQVVAETHSDHVLNGICIAVRSGILPPDDASLLFFERQEDGGIAKIEAVSPRIDRNGRIDQWPDGFFDEWDKSLETLLMPVED